MARPTSESGDRDIAVGGELPSDTNQRTFEEQSLEQGRKSNRIGLGQLAAAVVGVVLMVVFGVWATPTNDGDDETSSDADVTVGSTPATSEASTGTGQSTAATTAQEAALTAVIRGEEALNARTAPTVESEIVGKFPVGSTVELLCFVRGQLVTLDSNDDGNDLWHLAVAQVDDDMVIGYVTDVFLSTPTDPSPPPGETECDDESVAPTAVAFDPDSPFPMSVRSLYGDVVVQTSLEFARVEGDQLWTNTIDVRSDEVFKVAVNVESLDGVVESSSLWLDTAGGLESVPGTTKVFNLNHPDGVSISDNLTTEGINIEDIGEGGNSYVTARLRVPADAPILTACGQNAVPVSVTQALESVESVVRTAGSVIVHNPC
ncbi:MAG: hypothetical protein AAFY28_09020 [Actinomycetota bacterium]